MIYYLAVDHLHPVNQDNQRKNNLKRKNKRNHLIQKEKDKNSNQNEKIHRTKGEGLNIQALIQKNQ